MKLTRVSFSFALFKSSVGLLSEVDIPVDGRGEKSSKRTLYIKYRGQSAGWKAICEKRRVSCV